MADNFVDMIHSPLVEIFSNNNKISETTTRLKEKFPYAIFKCDTKAEWFLARIEISLLNDYRIIIVEQFCEHDLIPQYIEEIMKRFPERTYIISKDAEFSEIEELVRKASSDANLYLYENEKMTIEELKKVIICYIYHLNQFVSRLEKENPIRFQYILNQIVNSLKTCIAKCLDKLGGVSTIYEAIQLINQLRKQSLTDLNKLHIFGFDKNTIYLSDMYHEFNEILNQPLKVMLDRLSLAEGINLDDEEVPR